MHLHTSLRHCSFRVPHGTEQTANVIYVKKKSIHITSKLNVYLQWKKLEKSEETRSGLDNERRCSDPNYENREKRKILNFGTLFFHTHTHMDNIFHAQKSFHSKHAVLCWRVTVLKIKAPSGTTHSSFMQADQYLDKHPYYCAHNNAVICRTYTSLAVPPNAH